MFPINAAFYVALCLFTVKFPNINAFVTHNPGISTAPQGLAKLGDEPKHHLRHRKYDQQGPSFHSWAPNLQHTSSHESQWSEDGSGAWPHDITGQLTRAKSHASDVTAGVGALNSKATDAPAHGGKPGAGGTHMVPRTHVHGKTFHKYEWSYRDPTGWKEGYPLCSGKAQSPIDLPGNISIDDSPTYKPEEPLQVSYVPIDGLHLDNKGHTVQLDGHFGNFTLKSGTYQALQLHFHFPSEHMINGKQYPGEMQIVHQKINATGTNELAVIGILLDDEHRYERGFTFPETEFMMQLGFQAPEPVHGPGPAPAAAPAPPPVAELPTEGASHSVEGIIDIGKAFKQELTGGYYHYEGSLTTPPCSETVEWFVLFRPAPINVEMIRNFKKLFPDPANNRPVQRRYDRQIEFSTDKISTTTTAEPAARDSGPQGSQICFLGFGLLLAMQVNA